MREGMRLRAVKLIHTLAWAFFATCVVLIPFAASIRRFGLAGLLIGIVAGESLVLLVNSWRCPLTDAAARYRMTMAADEEPSAAVATMPQRMARKTFRVTDDSTWRMLSPAISCSPSESWLTANRKTARPAATPSRIVSRHLLALAAHHRARRREREAGLRSLPEMATTLESTETAR